MKCGVVVFPGSNCDHDAWYAVTHNLGHQADFIWHRDTSVGDCDAVILPGGFSYGDYLRTGAIARFSPVMREVVKFAEAGGTVIGICNGFQILLEAGLLPGAMLRNQSLHFVCKYVHLRTDSQRTPFTGRVAPGKILRLPVAHGEGNYFCDDATLKCLQREKRIVFRYCDAAGHTPPAANPNGSRDHIAGICSERGNVLGLMPHPERAMELSMGSTDGRELFYSLLATALVRRH